MPTTLTLHVLSAFAVGGGLVGLLSLIAERVPQKLAGIILSLPSTMAIGLFFLGITQSPSAIRLTLPALPVMLGVSLLCTVVYVHTAVRVRPAGWSVLLSTLAAIALWLLCAWLLVHTSQLSFFRAVILYAVVALVSHHLLRREHTTPVSTSFTHLQLLLRSLFAGTVIGLVVALSSLLGPVWGMMLSVFPAATLSQLLVVHQKRGSRFLFHTAAALPLASPIFILYGMIAAWSFPLIGNGAGTALAYLASCLSLWWLYRVHLPSPKKCSG